MARKPIPNETLKNRGSRRARKSEPEFSGELGRPVRELSGFALDQWKFYVSELDKAKIGSRIDSAALTALCEAWGDFDAACTEIEKSGTVVETERGMTRNPACLNKNQAMVLIAKLSSEFGFTPSSRAKVQGPAKAPENDFAGF